MKSIILLTALCVLIVQSVVAGGILTNANQSAQYVRMLSRNASTQLDAVYFNPAGLMKLENGFHFGIHNQTLFQTRTITTEAPINNREFSGEVSIPVFPTAFAVYKKDKVAFSFGFGPNSGGGTATYDKGLPSFEKQIAVLPGMISGMGVPTTAYDVDMFFDASSVFWGLQLGMSYEINETFSVYGGARYLPSINKYEGYIKDIMINPQHPQLNPTGGMMLATDFFSVAAPTSLALVQDKEVDVKQTGTGFTPILGLSISPSDVFNIGVKYEFKTSLVLTNETKADGTGMFPDGQKTRSDLPAILAVGVDYKLTDKFLASVSFNNYFDKAVDWGNNIYGFERVIDNNYWELSLGLQYDISEKFAISVGGMQSTTGVSEQYQSDFSYSNSSNTVACGFQWKATKSLTLDAGMLYTAYKDEDKSFGTYSETYDKENVGFAIGVAYSIF
jgi:long-chain fatty acid transport protein